MTTPSEEEALELARALDHAYQEWQWTAARNDQTFGEFAAPLVASRVSTPPADAECAHEAWEECGSGRRCADCRQYLDSVPPVSTPPSEDEGVTARLVMVNQLDVAIGGVLFNVSNFPERVQPYLLGQNMAPLRTKILDAVLATLDAAPVPAVPVLPTEPEETQGRSFDPDDHSDHARCGECAEWPTSAPTEPEEKR